MLRLRADGNFVDSITDLPIRNYKNMEEIKQENEESYWQKWLEQINRGYAIQYTFNFWEW